MALLKFLLIFFIVGYVFSKGLAFLARIFLGRHVASQFSSHRQQQTKRTNGSVNVDYDPKKKSNAKTDFKGGEYVDFEEVE